MRYLVSTKITIPKASCHIVGYFEPLGFRVCPLCYDCERFLVQGSSAVGLTASINKDPVTQDLKQFCGVKERTYA